MPIIDGESPTYHKAPPRDFPPHSRMQIRSKQTPVSRSCCSSLTRCPYQPMTYFARCLLDRHQPADAEATRGRCSRARVDALQAVTSDFVRSKGIAIVPRGGGLSYSGGYTPATAAVDPAGYLGTGSNCRHQPGQRHRDRRVRRHLGNALARAEETRRADAVLRTLLRRDSATIGGALSQHAASLGSSAFGISAENVLNLDIVTGDGSLLSTGSRGAENGHNFYRYFGPDLTGLFLGDCGALGIKARDHDAADTGAPLSFCQPPSIARPSMNLAGANGRGRPTRRLPSAVSATTPPHWPR